MLRDRLVPLLEAHIKAFAGPFRWGEVDCMRSAGTWVETVTGENILARYPRWRGAKSAAAIIRRAGFTSLPELVSSHLPEQPLAFVRLGDLVAIEGGAGPAIGIAMGNRRTAFLLPSGFELFPLHACERAWTVG